MVSERTVRRRRKNEQDELRRIFHTGREPSNKEPISQKETLSNCLDDPKSIDISLDETEPDSLQISNYPSNTTGNF